MIRGERVIVLDVDGTICETRTGTKSYGDLKPIQPMVEKLRKYHQEGFYVILYTSRQMRTYDGNIGRIIANTARVMIDWLQLHEIPYDELHFGKPWCGTDGFYVDDKAVRPREFLELSMAQIKDLLKRDEV